MEELITVIDRNRNPLGVKTRSQIHIDGDWHETFQCWFIEKINEEMYIHLQLRSNTKKDFPSLYDITAAGHLLSDETPKDGVREIKEELGVEISYEELHFINEIADEITLTDFIDKEIALVYLYEIKKDLTYKFMDQEVEGIIRVKLDDFTKLVNQEKSITVFEQYSVKGFTLINGNIKLNDLVPHKKNYFRAVIQGIKQYSEMTSI
jgi:isopentenyldiphosphate isomerase